MSKQENSPEDRLDDLPKRIERLLEHLGIRNVELARRLGVSRSYVTNLRKGHHCSLPVLTLFEKLERECFRVSVEATRLVAPPVPPRPEILPLKVGVGGFQSFPAGPVPSRQKEEKMGVARLLSDGGEVAAPRQVEMPREWKPMFLPLWRQYDVATRSLGQLCEVSGAIGCLTTDVADEKSFAMRVEGDEMAPQIYGGDYIVVSPNEEIRTGGVALGRLKEEDGGGVLLRQVGLTERGRVLGNGEGAVPLKGCVWVARVCHVVRRV